MTQQSCSDSGDLIRFPAAAVPESSSRLSTPLSDEPKRLPVKTASTQTEAEPRREHSVLTTALF
ncbi:hypothetical protein DPMN_066323 [Dreissena polymorpha]|uniref:Uncharacterized protein n=1 Tax=Dreissena polymorpha TaxID=45954 RepID=A0A9D3YY69_DREPO|nr:hypothetical protein DPMN_066323 [Dreissena polymorpha]